MSKELEALERIRVLLEDKYGLLIYVDELDIIEKKLKKLETLEEGFMSLTETNMELVQERIRNQKKLKAFEIIKNKRVNVEWLLETENVEEYNESLYDNLTQEEYDLVKEILR